MPHVHNALHHFTKEQAAFRKIVREGDEGFTGIERAGETVTPVVNLWDRPEWAALRGETPWSLFHAQAAVAAEFGFVGLRNPASSGGIAVVERIRVWSATAAVSSLIRQGPTLATDIDGLEDLAPRDTRLPLTGIGPLQKFHGAGAAQLGNDGLESVVLPSALTFGEYAGIRIVSPGFDLRVYGGVVNTTINVVMIGRFYRSQGELTL